MRDRLREASRRRHVVSFSRGLETGSVLGYVSAVGPELFMLALLESMRFNGFQVFRYRDVRQLSIPHKYADFVQDWMRVGRLRVPRRPRVRLDDMSALLRSASLAFPLVTIHREKVDAGVCHIGRVVGVDAKSVTLREIDPSAKWDAEDSAYRLSEITRVDLGGNYEDALARVAKARGRRQTPSSGRSQA